MENYTASDHRKWPLAVFLRKKFIAGAFYLHEEKIEGEKHGIQRARKELQSHS